MARCGGEGLMARTIPGLLEGARQVERLHLLLVRALSLPGQAHIFVGRPVSRAGVCAPHCSSLEGQWLAAQYPLLHDGGKYWRWCWGYDGEGRAVVSRLCRIHDDRRRWCHLL